MTSRRPSSTSGPPATRWPPSSSPPPQPPPSRCSWPRPPCSSCAGARSPRCCAHAARPPARDRPGSRGGASGRPGARSASRSPVAVTRPRAGRSGPRRRGRCRRVRDPPDRGPGRAVGRGLPDRVRGPAGDALQLTAVAPGGAAVAAAMLTRDRLEASDPLLLALPVLLGLRCRRPHRPGRPDGRGGGHGAGRTEQPTDPRGRRRPGRAERAPGGPAAGTRGRAARDMRGCWPRRSGTPSGAGADRAAWGNGGRRRPGDRRTLRRGAGGTRRGACRRHRRGRGPPGRRAAGDRDRAGEGLRPRPGPRRPGRGSDAVARARGSVAAPGPSGSTLEAVVSSDLEIAADEASLGYAQTTVPVTVTGAGPGRGPGPGLGPGLRCGRGRPSRPAGGVGSAAAALAGAAAVEVGPDVEGLRALVREVCAGRPGRPHPAPRSPPTLAGSHADPARTTSGSRGRAALRRRCWWSSSRPGSPWRPGAAAAPAYLGGAARVGGEPPPGPPGRRAASSCRRCWAPRWPGRPGALLLVRVTSRGSIWPR